MDFREEDEEMDVFWRGWNIGKQMMWFFHAVFEILIVLQNEYYSEGSP